MNPLHGLEQQGLSVWLQDLERSHIWTGALHTMVREDRLKGVLWTPAALERSIANTSDYSPALAALVSDGSDPNEAGERLMVEDVQWACDILTPLHFATEGLEGFCSVPLSPHLAHDPAETLEEASRLWDLVARDNLMLAVPATPAGLEALPELIAQGFNVHASHVFSLERFQEVQEGFWRGLEDLVRSGGDPSSVAAMTSVPLHLVDDYADAQIEDRAASADPATADRLAAARGRVASAIAQLVLQAHTASLASERWTGLAAQGARPLRLVWCDVATGDDADPGSRYFEGFGLRDTTMVLPPALYQAVKDGRAAPAPATPSADEARTVISQLNESGVNWSAAADELENIALQVDIDSGDRLVSAIQSTRMQLIADAQPSMDLSLGEHEAAVEARIDQLDGIGYVRRLWAGDGTLFDESVDGAELAEQSLGWLDVLSGFETYADHLLELRDKLETDQVESVVVLAMGEAGLAPNVFAQVFGQLDGSPELLVLDSTVPNQIRAVEDDITPEETLFLVSSKDGDTLEARAFEAYFLDQVKTPDNFAVITDPDTDLDAAAIERDYVSVVHGDLSVADHFSALSPHGIVPVAAMGLDVEELFDRVQLMVGSCSYGVPARDNPGVILGAALGELAAHGRDKLTLFSTPGLAGFLPWLEHLIAETTGKNGRGIVPVVGESLATPDRYGNDRVFVFIALEDDEDDAQSAMLDRIDALHEAGHPLLTFTLSDPRDLAQEMFRWQVAATTAAHVIGVNPFDQPDDESSESDADEGTPADGGSESPAQDSLAQERVADGDGIVVYSDRANAQALSASDLPSALRAHLDRLQPGQYFALTAFVEPTDANAAALEQIRNAVRDRYRVATTVGFGPQCSYATGQLHRSGPDTGLYMQVTCDDAEDIPVPELDYTFGELKAAQQDADFDAMSKRERRQIRVHLGADAEAGLGRLAGLLGGASDGAAS